MNTDDPNILLLWLSLRFVSDRSLQSLTIGGSTLLQFICKVALLTDFVVFLLKTVFIALQENRIMFDKDDPGFLSGFIGVIMAAVLALVFRLIKNLCRFPKLLKNLEDEVQSLQNSRKLDMLVQEASIMVTDAHSVPWFHIIKRFQLSESMDKLISDIRNMSLTSIIIHEAQQTGALPDSAMPVASPIARPDTAEEMQHSVALPDAAEEMQHPVALQDVVTLDNRTSKEKKL